MHTALEDPGSEAYDQWVREGRPNPRGPKHPEQAEPEPDTPDDPENQVSKSCIPCQMIKAAQTATTLTVVIGATVIIKTADFCRQVMESMENAYKTCGCSK